MERENNNFERRSHQRFHINSPLEIKGNDFQIMSEMKNISVGGVFCRSDRYIPVKTKLKVTMELPGQSHRKRQIREFTCPAEVSRIDPPQARGIRDYNLGIEFLSLAEQDRDLILRFVRRKNAKEAKELKKMYTQLKAMVAKLLTLEECHPTAEHFRNVISGAIAELDNVAYILDHEIDELRTLE